MLVEIPELYSSCIVGRIRLGRLPMELPGVSPIVIPATAIMATAILG
jgi:hypothetical protein